MKRLGLLIFIVAVIGSLSLVSFVSGKSLMPSMPSFWQSIKGSGNMKTERRNVPTFKAVDVGGASDVEIVVGREQSVELEYDDNLLPLVKTEVRGDTLHISREKGNIRSNNSLRVRITVAELDGLDLSGASKANVSGVKTEKFDLQVSGASKVSIDGTARDLELDLSGASSINAETLMVETASVEASGASRATVNVSETLKADASGASRISYLGNPKSVSRDVSGASSISAK